MTTAETHSEARHAQPAPAWRCVRALLLLVALTGAAACSSDASGSPEQQRGEEQEEHRGQGEGAEEGEAGESQRVVTLSEAAMRTAAILVEPVRSEAASAATAGVELPAQVEADPGRVAVVSARAAGRIERLLAVPGDRVAAGQTLAMLYSPAYVTAQADLGQARRRAEALAGGADAEGAQALLTAARRRLEVLGVSQGTIARIERGEAMPSLVVSAPFAGSVVDVTAVTGASVDVGTALLTLMDLSTVNIAVDVPERFLAALRIGQGATVRVTAFPEQRFAGRVSRVVDVLNPSTRTVKALVAVANRDRVLKPGMFATVVLNIPGTASAARAEPVLSVPVSALVTDAGERLVFVEIAPRTYERREVLVAAGTGPVPAGGRVVVVSGLAPGERVVTRGAFTLKAELAKATLVDED